MEADEINSKPRSVITAYTYYIYPEKGMELRLPFDQLEAVYGLVKYLRSQGY